MPSARWPLPRLPLPTADALHRAIRSQRATATRTVRESIVSLAGLLGCWVSGCSTRPVRRSAGWWMWWLAFTAMSAIPR
jgi:hypothetical protein